MTSPNIIADQVARGVARVRVDAAHEVTPADRRTASIAASAVMSDVSGPVVRTDLRGDVLGSERAFLSLRCPNFVSTQ
jgi:hypothetical protein